MKNVGPSVRIRVRLVSTPSSLCLLWTWVLDLLFMYCLFVYLALLVRILSGVKMPAFVGWNFQALVVMEIAPRLSVSR